MNQSDLSSAQSILSGLSTTLSNLNQSGTVLSGAQSVLASYTPDGASFNGATENPPCAPQKISIVILDYMSTQLQAMRDEKESQLEAINDAIEAVEDMRPAAETALENCLNP